MKTKRISGKQQEAVALQPAGYPAKTLIDSKTGKPIMLKYTKHSKEIRRMARASSQRLIEALNDPTGLTPI